MADKGYAFFDHTADVGLCVTGGSLAELFIHAAEGLRALLIEESPVQPRERRPVDLRAASVEELLRLWLTELLVWFDAERFVPSAYELETVTATALRGQVQGERYDPERHGAGTEVKGVTRHQFEVREEDGRWEARLIFDV